MSAGHDHAHSFDGMNDDYKRRLMLVTASISACSSSRWAPGSLSGSQALKADALDFFADGITYALSFWAIGRPVGVRTGAAVLKGASLLAMGVWIAVTTLYQFFVHGVPEAEVMGAHRLRGARRQPALGLPADGLQGRRRQYPLGVAVLAQRRHRQCGGDGGGGVRGGAHNGAPDLIVAGVMAALFLSSSYQILTQSWREWQVSRAPARRMATSTITTMSIPTRRSARRRDAAGSRAAAARRSPALAADWTGYANARFGYAHRRAAGLCRSAARPTMATARCSRRPTASLTVFGGNVIGGDFEDEARQRRHWAEADGWGLTYQVSTPDAASFSGRRGSRMLYARLIALCGGTQFAMFALDYGAAELQKFDPVVERLVRSLKASGGSAAPVS